MARLYGEKGDTWPKVLSHNYRTYGGSRSAMRYKHYGIWQGYTWEEYYLNVKYLACGLSSLGFEQGDRLLIIGDNAPQWCTAELAAQANRGVSVGVYSELAAPEVRYVAESSEARFAVVEDQEQVDKLLELKEDLPLLRKIIYWNYKGLSHYKDALIMGYREILGLGKAYDAEHPGLFEKDLSAGSVDDPCAIVYTSGTTGAMPKAAVHTHATIRAGAESYLGLDPWKESDDIVPHLPPAWITGQWSLIGCHLLSGCVLNFAENPETRQRDAREIGPTIVLNGARVWESQAAAIQARMLDVDPFKRIIFRLLMPAAYGLADRRLRRERPGMALSLAAALARFILGGRIKASLGLSRARICYSTEAILSPDALRFYHALGLPLKSLYGTTEGGPLTGARKDAIYFDSVGPPFDGTEMRVADDGEIVYRTPAVFKGYYNDPQQTASVLRDGWFHSGDSCDVADGEIRFIDRTGSLIRMASGDTLAPQLVESRLRSSPYIKDAWVLAAPDGKYAFAIVVINFTTVARWAGKRSTSFGTFAELSQKTDVYDLIMGEIKRINSALPSGCRVRKFVNFHKEFDADAGELTRTRNVRRHVLAEQYRTLVEAIHAELTEASVDAPVGRQDGHTETRSFCVAIASVGGGTS